MHTYTHTHTHTHTHLPTETYTLVPKITWIGVAVLHPSKRSKFHGWKGEVLSFWHMKVRNA